MPAGPISTPRPDAHPMWTRRHLFYFLAAAAISLALHLGLVAAWHSTFANDPWRGYAPGVAPAFFTSSPKSLMLALAAFAIMALGLTLIPSGRAPWIGLAIWAGVMAAIVAAWIATPALRHDSNMWPISLVILAAETGLPMLVGRTFGLLYWRVRIGQAVPPALLAAAAAALLLFAWLYR
jgi:hypothetical protein